MKKWMVKMMMVCSLAAGGFLLAGCSTNTVTVYLVTDDLVVNTTWGSPKARVSFEDYGADYSAFDEMYGVQDSDSVSTLEGKREVYLAGEEFKDSVEYTVTYPEGKENGDIANGDVITITASYDEEAAKEFQAAIDKAGDDYISTVASYRGIPKDKAEAEFGKGGVVDAEYAMSHGMVDKIATLEDVYRDISSTAEAEGRGEDMEVNVNALSSEERARIFNEITALDPSLISSALDDARKTAAENERKRIEGLNALAVAGNAEIAALIRAAIEDGRSASDIGLECFEIMKKGSAGRAAQPATAVLEALADDTVSVDVPQGEDSVDALIDRAIGNKEEK